MPSHHPKTVPQLFHATIFQNPLNISPKGQIPMLCRVTHIGTATLLLEIGTLRLLTDPVFDPPGGSYNFGFGTGSKKTTGPAIALENIGPIDAILLSHDQHDDNLDRAGRTLLPRAGRVLTTVAGTKRLGGNAQSLTPWQATTLPFASGETLKVTAMPARHGSLGSHLFGGETIGFMLEWPGQKHGALYISGDTVWFNGLAQIAQRVRVGTAFLHIGKASFPITGPLHFTLTAQEAIRLARVLAARTIIPIHYEGWAHFQEPMAQAKAHFAAAGLESQVRWFTLGAPTELEV